MASRCSASDAGSRVSGVAQGELNQLEEVILSKIQQRVPTRMSEDTYIVKACKYHDLSESGWIDFPKFKRAFAPFTPGILDQDVRLIFDRYAPEGSLFYKQFALEFVRGTRRDRSAALPLGSEAAAHEQAWEAPEEALMRMKAFLCSSGPRAVIDLAMAFREVDPENTRAVGQEAFHAVISELFSSETGCPVQDALAAQISGLFQQPMAPGQIAYDEFMQAFKDEPLSPDRREAVRAAFRRLDKDSEGLVGVHHMMDVFNPTRHPFVSDASHQPEDIVAEFSETFRDCLAYRRGQRSYPTNLVAWEEFEDYYKLISGCYESDALFCTILQRVWDLDKAPNSSIESRAALARPAAGIPAKSRAGLHHWQSETLPRSVTHNKADECVTVGDIVGHARRQIAKRGLRAAADVVKNFYAADDDVDDLLDIYDFRRACQQSGISLREPEEQMVFEACGVDPPGGALQGGPRRGRLIHLQKWLRLLHGPLSPQRLELIERAFGALGGDPNDEESLISPVALKEGYVPEAHPLVQKGEADAGVLLGDFLDTFSLLAHVRGGCQSGMVAFSDFFAYYDLVSSTVESDALFDLLMHRLWPIDAETLHEQEEAARVCADVPPGSPSKRERWAMPVYEAGDRAVPRQKPPVQSGPGAYARAAPAAPQPDTHRRFSRSAAPAPPPQEGPNMNQSYGYTGAAPTVGFSSITKSSIVFNETASGELGAVLRRLRDSLAKRGLKGWRMLGERFQQHDHRRNGGVMRGDWQRLHRSLGLGMSPEEQEVVFKSFVGGRKDGAMDFPGLLAALRGPLPERRAALVGRLFDELAQGGDLVPPAALKARFDAKNTPLVLVGTRDALSERQDFDGAVDHFSSGNGFDAQAFAEFFTMLSSMYKEEDEFKLMTTTVFGLRGASIGGC